MQRLVRFVDNLHVGRLLDDSRGGPDGRAREPEGHAVAEALRAADREGVHGLGAAVPRAPSGRAVRELGSEGVVAFLNYLAQGRDAAAATEKQR
jgi:hypothetical protein